MQESMTKTMNQLKQTVKDMGDAANELNEQPFHKPSRKALLNSAKEIMTHTVALGKVSLENF